MIYRCRGCGTERDILYMHTDWCFNCNGHTYEYVPTLDEVLGEDGWDDPETST